MQQNIYDIITIIYNSRKPYVFIYGYMDMYGLSRWQSGTEYACQCRRFTKCGFDPWVWKISWRRKRQPTPGFLPGKFHKQRSLVSYRPWDGRVRHD